MITEAKMQRVGGSVIGVAEFNSDQSIGLHEWPPMTARESVFNQPHPKPEADDAAN